MKKRLLAAALALCLALTLLPMNALAAGRPASTDYWIDMTTEEARQMLRAVADGSESRYIVFVYYGAAFLTAAQQFSDYANKNTCRIYNYAYTGSESLADELAPLLGGAAPTQLPVAVTFNPSTKTCLARENVVTLLAPPTAPDINGLLDLMRENGVSSGSTLGPTPGGPDVPPVGPDDPPVGPGSGSSIPNIHEYAWEVLRLVNQHRMGIGLQPLSVFAELQQAANIRAEELYDYCSHTRPDGRDYSTVFADLNIPATSWAENIASGQRNAADVMNSWLNSPGHRANIEKASGRAHLGVGYYYNADHPYLHASNWSQNFVSCSNCSFSGLRLSETSVAGRLGVDLESLLTAADIEVTATCYRHGLCSLPLITAMCSGYNANDTGDQTLTVTYGGQTATLTVTGAHTHTWDGGVETRAPSCTDPGVITSVCSVCGTTKSETIPASGHNFSAAEEEGMYACVNAGCEVAVPAELAAAYPELKDSFSSFDMAASAVIDAYLKECAENTLRNCDNSYSCDILNGRFVENNAAYAFSVGIRQIFARTLDYILITEPLTIALNIGDAVSDVYPVVTPDEEQPVVPPANPLLPPPPTSAPSVEAYSIFIPETTGGEVSVSPHSAKYGAQVTLSIHPDSGYVLDILKVTDASGQEITLRNLKEGKYSFVMPASKVTITAAFKKIDDGSAMGPEYGDSSSSPDMPGNPAPMPFADVSSRHWFYDSVDYVWKHDLMIGVSDTRFAPDETISRAMIWTILARMHGVSADRTPGASWYEPGTLWAVQRGVSDGTNPADGITREQLAAMLWRDADSPNAGADLSSFTDSGSVSGYAQSAMRWAVASGIMQGAGGMLHPKKTASRAEAAVMIARYAGQLE